MLRLRYTWPTEVNGYGQAYRTWLHWPRLAPLPFNSDHGICLHSTLEEHEKHAAPRRFLTWNKHRFDSLHSGAEKEVIRVPCPWAMYRREKNIRIEKEARGTLLFVPHSTSQIKTSVDIEIMLENAIYDAQLPPPYTFIIHHLDANRITVDQRVKRQAMFYSLGLSQSWNFIEKFYRLVRNYSFATSPKPGSELFYCAELGLSYVVSDVNVTQEPAATDALQFRRTQEDKLYCELRKEMRRLFSASSEAKSQAQQQFIAEIMSLDLATDSFTRDLKRKMPQWMREEAFGYAANLLRK